MLERSYRAPALSLDLLTSWIGALCQALEISTKAVCTETCFNLGLTRKLSPTGTTILTWLLAETFDPRGSGKVSFLRDFPTVIEVGPRRGVVTPFSTQAVAICHDCGLSTVYRLEQSVRYGFPRRLNAAEVSQMLALLVDRMTEEHYPKPISSFESDTAIEPVMTIPLIEEGMPLLRQLNKEMGLAMDDQDLMFCLTLFVNVLRRNPTNVELFQIGQANSEHCRHGFWKGQHIIDGVIMPETLMELVQAPWRANPSGSVIAFHDDSSAIESVGLAVTLAAELPNMPSRLAKWVVRLLPTLTAETHNFPTGVAPYPGAQTGTGGRIRDNMAVGQGGHMLAGGAGYCVDNLCIPGYPLPWEAGSWSTPPELASALRIAIEASNGASDYGNCIGEPVPYGFARALGMDIPSGRRGFIKPIMYSAGLGQLNAEHAVKGQPEPGMLVVQIGGPAYKIGLGGGAASSMLQGDNAAGLDFDAVQRGDAEMEQRTWRVIRACIEGRRNNPIVTIHDLGAGGDANAVPEILTPAGGRIKLRNIPVGDKTLTTLVIWGNESQERMVFLIQPEDLLLVNTICERESCPIAILGEITGDGQITLIDDADETTPVDLPLARILEGLPQKTWRHERIYEELPELVLPEGLSVRQALNLVFRLLSVGSHAWLTRKVDRSVTGLVIQQQCVGPNHLPVADCAVLAHGYFSDNGMAASLGEQPVKGLISPAAMARLAVAEALLNMAGVLISSLDRVSCSANWMWAAKQPGEGARLYDAAVALRDCLVELGMKIDGGKDSLSMATRMNDLDGKPTVVKAPGQLVIAAYAAVADVDKHVSVVPDANDLLYLLDVSPGMKRLGGSALAQTLKQVGNDCPDVEDVDLLKRTYEAVQELLRRGIITAVHDVSDGGLITTMLEMCMAGNVGLYASLESQHTAIETLFAEEPGIVISLCKENLDSFAEVMAEFGMVSIFLGNTLEVPIVEIRHNGVLVLGDMLTKLRSLWEETSTRLDALQANPVCVEEERKTAKVVTPPPYKLTFVPPHSTTMRLRFPVAILRATGSNGDREMAAAFHTVGFDPWDVTVSDLVSGRIDLDRFRGVVPVGGFSYRDTLGSGKGWAGVIRNNKRAAEAFARFYARSDTFSLGVCNGCQVMTLLGIVPWYQGIETERQPRFIHNRSGRFESRFPTVEIGESPAIMLQGMAGSRLGIWVAHGEGYLHAEPDVLDQIEADGLAPIRYVDAIGEATETYPYNPNGSQHGIAALCSPDGRHLAMMPHPERVFQLRQWPWLPPETRQLSASPWLQMFENAYKWCDEV
ncbi:phosphoribosylformylglycinamidine synthase [Candidatus Berkelbacteria bacterium CG10_big_fil_rev_8_21_14_0_10_43_13]|uniref:Phosphoribosylformylglycinamidine synthase n=1 Tax=Candidatus Berkelbacteria bacterium CG10_big_fil_rev_8_21_14_0_10_43_13 TaxID=1974514 RepID=A0A2H0W871_9BACT|nr:MAG: phosphoribosylformylglycinamidine synthase [Candidatus Berkelbacteria bacterium CG10_big_fil_rev_8_21_14_0_10_43_13]